MINLLIKFALITHSHGETLTETADKDKIVYIDFEDVSVNADLSGPRLTLVLGRVSAKPDMLVPDVRQLFIDKNGKRVTPSSK
jgi:hypothetical protein